MGTTFSYIFAMVSALNSNVTSLSLCQHMTLASSLTGDWKDAV